MIEYLDSARISIILGIVAFGVLLVPIIVVQYRRFGRMNVRRLLGAILVSVYGVALAEYTLFPTPPDRDAVCDASLQPVPFHFIADIVRETQGLGVASALSSVVVLQVVFNVVLFVPLGVLVRRFFSRGILVTVVAGLVLSCVIEVTQYTGIFGIYPCPYRLADVDDILTNVTGALIGALIAPAVLAWMPQPAPLATARNIARPLTVWRRWLGMLLDLLAIAGLGMLATTAIVQVPAEVGLWEVHEALRPVIRWGPGLLLVVFLALAGSGASLGQRIVFLRPVRDAVRPSLGRRLLRAGVVSGVYVVAAVAASYTEPLASTLIGALVLVVLAIDVISVPVTRSHRGFSSLVAGTEIIDSRSVGRLNA